MKILSIFGLTLSALVFQSDFLTEQKKFGKVRTAISEKQALVEQRLRGNNLSLNELNILLVAYKDDDVLEVYGKSKQETSYRKIASFEICTRSGQLGPKRRQGDGQVPEGFYYIDRFNPNSSFYLSLGINYPNLADMRKSKASDLGGDIFIHGSCVTVGCIPMTDEVIKEVYVMAVHAKNNGQNKIPVYVFPFRMSDANMVTYKTRHKDDAELLSFWSNLKVGYDKFVSDKREVSVEVTQRGDYTF
ncbi:MAG: murein L,D-transpeptidase family protein [Cyclobacteriaceae bacterium]